MVLTPPPHNGSTNWTSRNTTGSPGTPRLSVIIPTLNEEGVVDRLLGELIQGATPEIEIIVADSCSTDGTPAIVEALAHAHPDLIRLARSPARGVSLARNTGAKLARGRYLAFLDADARISVETLLKGVTEMEQRGLVTAAFRFISGSDFWGDRLIASLFNLSMGFLQYVAPTAPGSAGYLIQCDAHDRHGGFNETMHFGEDVEYLRRVSQGAKFRLFKQGRIVLDMRRFQEEGRLFLLWKMFYGTLAQIITPVVEKLPFEYKNGHPLPVRTAPAHEARPQPRILASSYDIIGRRPRLIPAEMASPGHLFKRPCGQTDMIRLLRERGDQITPYCLDDRRRCLLLLETPKPIDLLTANPFFYEAQRDHAIRIHAVAYSDLERLTDIILPADQAPAPVFLHSTGRCGSTLLSQLLGITGNFQSVSEPDFYSQAVILSRLADGQRDQELRRLMDGCTRLLSHHLYCRDAKATRPLIKLRSWCLFAAPLFEPLSGRWHNIFLYRDPLPTINSFLNAYFSKRQYHIWRRWRLDSLLLSTLGALPFASKTLGATVPLFNHAEFRRDGRKSATGYFTLQWLSHMAESTRLQQRNAFFSALIRYEELLDKPFAQVHNLLSSIGESAQVLPQEEALAAVLARNSQQGSRMQSKGEYLLSSEDEQTAQVLLQRCPIDWPRQSAVSSMCCEGGVGDAQTSFS